MKKGEKICIAISAIILLWLFVSFIEVNAKNLEPNPQYNDWNAFVLLTERLRFSGILTDGKIVMKLQNGKMKNHWKQNIFQMY